MSAPDIVLDYRGQRCPAPIIALGRQTQLTPGAAVKLLADDPAAQFDVPAWCRMRGATLLRVTPAAGSATQFQVLLPPAASSAQP